MCSMQVSDIASYTNKSQLVQVIKFLMENIFLYENIDLIFNFLSRAKMDQFEFVNYISNDYEARSCRNICVVFILFRSSVSQNIMWKAQT